MAVSPEGRFGILVAAALALTGCDEAQMGNLFSGGDTASGASSEGASPRAGGAVRVVEAPEIFDVADTALWDGRPSLGLIWVAYEGADPTNVMIRNEENGKFVVGALYRRERFFPGPPFQLSSDAAAELGILAGNPTRIRVVALKEEAVAPEPPAEPAPAETAAVAEADPDILPPPAAGGVSAAIDPIEVAAAAAIEAADPAGETPAVRPPARPVRRPTVEGPNAPLPRRIAAPEPAIPAPVQAAVSGPVIEPIAPPSAGVTTLRRPFIQVGIFSVAENAERTAQSLADAGIIPFVEEQRVGGRTFFRVVVGPATNTAERAALLAKVKAQGFGDAYFVRN